MYVRTPFARAPWLGLVLILLAGPLSAQVDLTGVYTPLFHEDNDERIPGPALVDYLGLPISDAGRKWALAWDPDRLTAQEHQCQVHTVAYMYRGPLLLRIWEERDPQTQEVIAIRQYISNYEQDRTIWMDGRPHPPPYAKHTWMGFSTGQWDGNILTVYTTHIKQGWHRRNGLPSSDEMTLVEHFIRHGDLLTHVTVATDPIYLDEPLVKTQDFELSETATFARGTNLLQNWLYPCEYVNENPGGDPTVVQSYLPNENPFVDEFARKAGVPIDAALGGPETMYPEYQDKLQQTDVERAR